MKTYRPNRSSRICVAIFLFLLTIGCIAFLIYNKEATALQRVIIFIGIIFVIGGIDGVIKGIKVLIDDEEIKVCWAPALLFTLLSGKKNINVSSSLKWREIEELKSIYILYPEAPIIILRPKFGVDKKHIEFPMDGISLELLKDILFHLPPDTKVYLYTYLKRKLEGKQIWFFKDQKDEEIGKSDLSNLLPK